MERYNIMFPSIKWSECVREVCWRACNIIKIQVRFIFVCFGTVETRASVHPIVICSHDHSRAATEHQARHQPRCCCPHKNYERAKYYFRFVLQAMNRADHTENANATLLAVHSLQSVPSVLCHKSYHTYMSLYIPSSNRLPGSLFAPCQ